MTRARHITPLEHALIAHVEVLDARGHAARVEAKRERIRRVAALPFAEVDTFWRLAEQLTAQRLESWRARRAA